MRYTHCVESAKASETYTRAEIRRILGINENTLRSWERVGLAEPRTRSYSFSDLICLRTLKGLRESRISAKRISEAVHQIRARLAHISSPLDELKIVSEGRRVAILLPGERIEAVTGQMVFDFEAQAMQGVSPLEYPEPEAESSGGPGEEYWFERALQLEQDGAPAEEVLDVYRKVLDCNPRASGAWLNMGTVHYRQGLLQLAEHCYEEAVRIFPGYALAHYNLGNICEETDRLREASDHYESALDCRSDYADAHFNLAVVCERREQFVKAATHWQCYLDLDPTSTWAAVARRKRDRLLSAAASETPALMESARSPSAEPGE